MKRMSEQIGKWMKFLFVMFLLCGFTTESRAQNYQKVVDLNGRWKFSIGDNAKWANPNFNDSNWERVDVPSAWENQGFHGYDGYAWYRTNFNNPNVSKTQSLYLKLGNIDDVDEVFINGKKIGQTGSFPPHFSTAYTSNRVYNIPANILLEKNVIAVRVYDDVGEGGIVYGDVSIVLDRDAIPVDIDLQGEWRFKTGRYAHENLQAIDSWDRIIVPGHWENQGYKNYDGYACYALDFKADEKLIVERMVLVLGKIDDIDQVIVNGVLVGQSGEFDPSTVRQYSDSYQQVRGYYLPPNLIKKGQKNRIVVRVFDAMEGGGIYTGSIGLISQDHYIKYWNKRRRR
ncbi:beta galactosidase jelly roll domain-containing protein [Labilibaculum filiforme]|nr:beta galactosidase jelly roll domain-containing protein [Labilibaculum filiforme]